MLYNLKDTGPCGCPPDSVTCCGAGCAVPPPPNEWQNIEWLEGAPDPSLYPLLKRLAALAVEQARVLHELQCPSIHLSGIRCKRFRGHKDAEGKPDGHSSDPYIFTNRVGIFGGSGVGFSWFDPEGAG